MICAFAFTAAQYHRFAHSCQGQCVNSYPNNANNQRIVKFALLLSVLCNVDIYGASKFDRGLINSERGKKKHLLIVNPAYRKQFVLIENVSAR